MLLERIGKFCFSKNRSLSFYLIITFPILLGFCSLFIQYTKWKDLEERFDNACKKGKTALVKKGIKERFIQRYTDANPYFLENEIESLTFLSPEINELKNLIQHPALADKRILEERLHFLTKGANQFSFTEDAIRSSPSIKEIEEKQRHPVQMNGEDLKKLLSLMEDVPIDEYPLINHRPQIVITDFRLEKKQTPLKTNVFEVEMQFIKREFIK